MNKPIVSKIEPSSTRPWVDAFADEMESKLAANRHRGDRNGWSGEAPHWLVARLLQEVNELIGTIEWPEVQHRDIYAARWMIQAAMDRMTQFGPLLRVPGGGAFVRSECADIANFAMMIADVAGGLKPIEE